MRGRARGWVGRGLEHSAIRKPVRSAERSDDETSEAPIWVLQPNSGSGLSTLRAAGCRRSEQPIGQRISELFTRVFLDEMTRVVDDLVGLACCTRNFRLQDLFGSGRDRIPVGE